MDHTQLLPAGAGLLPAVFQAVAPDDTTPPLACGGSALIRPVYVNVRVELPSLTCFGGSPWIIRTAVMVSLPWCARIIGDNWESI